MATDFSINNPADFIDPFQVIGEDGWMLRIQHRVIARKRNKGQKTPAEYHEMAAKIKKHIFWG